MLPLRVAWVFSDRAFLWNAVIKALGPLPPAVIAVAARRSAFLTAIVDPIVAVAAAGVGQRRAHKRRAFHHTHVVLRVRITVIAESTLGFHAGHTLPIRT